MVSESSRTDAPDDESVQTYHVGQYELHISTYEVEATSVAHAIKRLFDGDGNLIEPSPEFSNVVEDLGINAAENAELVRELRELGVEIEGPVVPSIASVVVENK